MTITETQDHRQLRLAIEREFGVGIGGNLAALTMDEAEMRALAEQVATRHRRRSGIRALKRAVGYERACQITGTRLQD